MKALISLAAIGWVLNTPGALITVCVVALGTMLLCARSFVRHPFEAMSPPMTWARIEPRFDDMTRSEDHRERARLLYRVEELERDLIEARRESDVLRGRNEQLELDIRAAKATTQADSTNSIYRRVGLHQDAPEWVIVAVRKAYRKRFHPDGYSAGQKTEAERRFVQAEQVFSEIGRIRGIQW
jgi:hypothetical protein